MPSSWWKDFLRTALPGFLLLLFATESELLGSAFLVRQDLLQSWWAYALVGHGLLSALTGLGGMMVLRGKYSQQHRAVGLFFFLFALCIPLLGVLGAMYLVVMFRYWEISETSPGIGTLSEQDLQSRGPHSGQYQIGDVRTVVSQSTVSDSQRMQALFKLQSLHNQQATETFRELLTDKSEDLRLVAFGLLDKTEKTIFSRVHQELTLLNMAETDESRSAHWRQLAYTYWELVYQQAVVGDVLGFAIDQVRVYATEVLFHEERDGGMWSVLGQVNLYDKEYDVAGYCFTRAMRCGLPESRIVPYLAEILFHQRDYSELQALMFHQPNLVNLFGFQPVMEYWGIAQPPMEAQNVHI